MASAAFGDLPICRTLVSSCGIFNNHGGTMPMIHFLMVNSLNRALLGLTPGISWDFSQVRERKDEQPALELGARVFRGDHGAREIWGLPQSSKSWMTTWGFP